MAKNISLSRISHGLALVEVLVAIVLIGIGILGMAGLQVTGFRNTQQAVLAGQVSFMTSDIAERMRANPQAVDQGLYHLGNANLHNECSSMAGCTVLQLAETDMFEWNNFLANNLVMGEGVVCVDGVPENNATPNNPQCDNFIVGGNNPPYVVKIWWDRDLDGVQDQAYVIPIL